ncbi:MAG TPA: AsmA family protein [Verrucomicrobiae bacterium]|nr:AsmA family protein [Verrucomicrobiae bacterium]
MKKVKKILLGVVIALLVIAIVAVMAVGMFLGKIVKTGMETVGPKITQTTLTVGSVDMSLLSGSASIKNLVLGNPEGYKDKSPNAITVGLAAVSVSPMSVMSDKIVVKSVRVESPEITFLGNPLGQNNLKKIEDNVNAATASFQSAPATQPAKTSAPAKPGKKLEVDEFTITGAKVHIGSGATLTLPDIHLTDLGKGPDGITPADLTKQVLSQVVNGTIKAVAGAATNVGKDAGKAVGSEVNKITGGLGGLFKKSTN